MHILEVLQDFKSRSCRKVSLLRCFNWRSGVGECSRYKSGESGFGNEPAGCCKRLIVVRRYCARRADRCFRDCSDCGRSEALQGQEGLIF